MKRSRRKLEELTWALGVHSVAVRLHRLLGRRESTAPLVRFYSSLLQPGSLVFDIGANVGIYSEAMESVGSRVIAVEPNADCVRHIQLTYGGRRIETLQAAVGPENGVASLNVSDGHDDSSSFVRGKNEANWDRSVSVPVLTVDSLIKYFGMPAYIKIDVEGYESAVLKGLSKLPRLLSFEFHYLYAERAREALDSPLFAGRRLAFNITDQTECGFEFPEWVSLNRIKEATEKVVEQRGYRDIFVHQLE